jgi:iron complex transport system substrate-binding protein
MNLRRLALTISALLMLVMGAHAQDANLTACVSEGEYDASADYFADEVSFTHAENVTVEYFNNYKVVTVSDAYDGAPEPFTYVLVQCGTPAPDTSSVPANAQIIDVPITSLISLSTTQLPHLIALDALDVLVGMDTFLYVNAPEVRAMIDEGALFELGFNRDINLEVALDAEPDLAMGYAFFPDSDSWPLLLDAGIPVAINAEWREGTLLGRAEWIKFTALFVNGEDRANEVFDAVESEYVALAELGSSVPEDERPVVLWNTVFGDTWAFPALDSYTGELMRNGGGLIALAELANEDSTALLSFETVYEGALDADLWILNAFATPDLDALAAQDARYADFAAFQSGNVWNNDLVVNENGGTDFFERGAAFPQLILADIIAILHPELLPDHEFNFFRQLD